MKKPNILFIQGGGEGAYKEDRKLFLYLEGHLKGLYQLHYPAMPQERHPNYEIYKAKIDAVLKKIDTRVVLAGHSLGSCFLLKYLSEERINRDIAGIFLIATPFWGGRGWQYEGFRLKNDFAASIAPGVPLFFYHSTDDKVVPFSHLALYQKEVPHATFRIIDGRGHQLNDDLSEVVEDIRSLTR